MSRQARMIAKRGKKGLCMKKASQRFYFNHILDTLRNLRAKIFETTGVAKARNLHDFVMLATYVRASGRSKETRAGLKKYAHYKSSLSKGRIHLMQVRFSTQMLLSLGKTRLCL